jgi:hypothetical protein
MPVEPTPAAAPPKPPRTALQKARARLTRRYRLYQDAVIEYNVEYIKAKESAK